MCTMCLTLLAELITFAWILQTQRPKQEITDQLPVFLDILISWILLTWAWCDERRWAQLCLLLVPSPAPCSGAIRYLL